MASSASYLPPIFYLLHIHFRFDSTDLCLELEDPPNVVTILKDDPLTTTLDVITDNTKFVQITPQKVRVKLRLDKEETIKFKVAQAKQYPVDLYYLMDLSNSMSDDRANVVSE